MTHKCLIRGHSHDLVLVKRHKQDGTGIEASTLECPSGAYRWFVIDGNIVSNRTRMNRPRWGWKS